MPIQAGFCEESWRAAGVDKNDQVFPVDPSRLDLADQATESLSGIDGIRHVFGSR
jgi:hypothetical protein